MVSYNSPATGNVPCEETCHACCLAKMVNVRALQASWNERFKARPNNDNGGTSPPAPKWRSNVIVVPLNKDLMLMKVGQKDCFVFGFGCLVCWGCKPEEAASAREALQPFLVGPLDAAHVDEDHIAIVQQDGGPLEVPLSCREPPTFERVALAYALAQSVRLGSMELRIERWIARTRSIPEQLARVGHTSLSAQQVTRMIGELYCLRHEVNLETDILDTPEFFWEYGDYEPLYQSCRQHLDVDQRVSVVNQRFEVLQDMFDVLETELNERHATRLEWVVIILCALEAVVMALRFYAHVLRADPADALGGNATVVANVAGVTAAAGPPWQATPLLSLALLVHRTLLHPVAAAAASALSGAASSVASAVTR